MLSRRQLLFAAAAVAFRNEALNLFERHIGRADPDPFATAEDEDFWLGIRQGFALDPNIVNFNNGGCSPSPRVVQDVLRRQQEYGNQAPSYYMWRNLEPEIESTRKRLAALFGCDPEELAITRNASESLETCLFGLPLQAGDEVLTTTQDYPRMITTIKQRERRDGVKMVHTDTPAAPKTLTELVRAFERDMTPRTKMMLVSHVVFLTGQIYPVREICKLGRERGIPVIVDGAHAFAQFPFDQKALGCDYYGTSLHKWLMAPIGTGFLYVKRDKIKGLWPLMAATAEQDDNIRKFEEIGTHQAALHNAIGEALTFHEMLGAERKAARLRYLRSRWTDVLRDVKKVRFHTNLAPTHSCGLTTVEIEGIAPGDLAAWLMEKHHIFVTSIEHPNFKGIRVTPSVYTTRAEVDRFGQAMLIAATHGIS
jgi:isopenicillin-N epimerase